MKVFKHLFIGLLIVAGSAVMLASCDKVDGLIKVNVPAQAAGIEFVIPQSDSGASHTTLDFSMNIDSLIKSKQASLGIANIKSVKIDSVTFTLTNADGNNNFTLIDSAVAAFSSDTNPTYITIGTVTPATIHTATSITVPVNQALDLKDYFDATVFHFRLYCHLTDNLTQDLNCVGNAYFNIQAGL